MISLGLQIKGKHGEALVNKGKREKVFYAKLLQIGELAISHHIIFKHPYYSHYLYANLKMLLKLMLTCILNLLVLTTLTSPMSFNSKSGNVNSSQFTIYN